MDQESARTRVTWPIALILTLFAISALVMVFRGEDEQSGPTPTAAPESVDLKSLPVSTTRTTLEDAPKDPRPDRIPKGTVVHPKRTVPLYDAPDGEPFAKIGSKQFGDTWLPVITRNRDWVQVLLPSRPNGSTGWIRSDQLREAHSRYLIRVHLGQRTMELFESNQLLGSWPVAIGAPATPTPTGRTFVLGQIIDDKQPFSPVILPLGSHSDTLDTYGGGPGTVAIHGWTDPSVFGEAVSHGCIRVPDEALAQVRTVPLGTPVVVDEA